MPHVINSRALTGEKPCINKAIHALLMHGYATFNMLIPGSQNCCRHEMCTPCPRTSIVRGNSVRATSVKKAKQNSARNNAKCSKCFQFLCNNSDRTWFSNALTFARSLGTWRMLIQEKPCLIPISRYTLLHLKHKETNTFLWKI